MIETDIPGKEMFQSAYCSVLKISMQGVYRNKLLNSSFRCFSITSDVYKRFPIKIFLDCLLFKINHEFSGKIVNENDLNSMIAEAPGPINFTMFLTIFGERISGEPDTSLKFLMTN